MALWTRVVLNHLLKPGFVPGLFDALLIGPQLNSVRLLRLKFLQVFAGVFLTRTAEVQTLFGSAGRHFTCFAEREAFFRPAALAFHIVNRKLEAFGKSPQPVRILVGGDEYATRWAKQAAHGRQPLVGLIEISRR
jgi:hypothetical protein